MRTKTKIGFIASVVAFFIRGDASYSILKSFFCFSSCVVPLEDLSIFALHLTCKRVRWLVVLGAASVHTTPEPGRNAQDDTTTAAVRVVVGCATGGHL